MWQQDNRPRSYSADITGLQIPVRGARSLTRWLGGFHKCVKCRRLVAPGRGMDDLCRRGDRPRRPACVSRACKRARDHPAQAGVGCRAGCAVAERLCPARRTAQAKPNSAFVLATKSRTVLRPSSSIWRRWSARRPRVAIACSVSSTPNATPYRATGRSAAQAARVR